MPKVSIIVPNYNHAPFLSKRLKSIFAQTYTNYEVILLDDASTDESIAVLSDYADYPKVSHFVINETNSGSPFQQWKKGLSLAQGKYVWIAESDDWADERFLATTVTQLDEQEQLGLVYTHSIEVDATDNHLGEKPYFVPKGKANLWKSDFSMLGEAFILNYLVEQNIIPNASAVLFRRDALDLSDDMPFRMLKSGDWWVWCQILMNHDVSFLSTPLNYFRRHAGSTRVYKNVESRKIRVKEQVTILRFLEKQLTVSESWKKDQWRKVGQLWRKLYLSARTIDKELFAPTISELRTLDYYLGFFRLNERRYYHLPYIALLPILFIYLSVKSLK